jgi:hypothetical protein
MSSIFANAGLDLRFADFQFGSSAEKSTKMTSKRVRNRRRQKVPDLIMTLNSNHQIQVVGELKTPWTFIKPKRISQAASLASKLVGILPRLFKHLSY